MPDDETKPSMLSTNMSVKKVMRPASGHQQADNGDMHGNFGVLITSILKKIGMCPELKDEQLGVYGYKESGGRLRDN